jgi:uncharacterized protein YgfB (UPF0149 family)
LEKLHRHNEVRKFYRKITEDRKGFEPRTNMCKAKDGTMLCDQQDVLNRWVQHFTESLEGFMLSKTDTRSEELVVSNEEVIWMFPFNWK